ncbi:flavin reductase domain-containing protein [Advenella kashmirensis WT001]|uniref:Flavin reductase domain-containing protein n=1 Tax=Advenella kashmirensis (strain DSM 17095 / LMG 22695 / WT001) TaxID=1036672 RepID=I3UG28_ADVKW|nr:flavin reductase family protein [Advenella kashmirensis]AFK63966.1 flavin reductase domain-containing protein [Advenella kashmirensis WT001]
MKIYADSMGPEQTYKLLTGIVVPRPIAWVSTLSETGLTNVAPFSCYTIVSNMPPMIGINIGRKAGVRKDTATNILFNSHFVVNIADETLLEPLHQSAGEYPPQISETQLLDLETLPGESMPVPRLVAAPISMECRLHSVTPYGDTGAEFFVGEIRVWHIRDGLLNDGKIDSTILRPICRLGGPNYATLGKVVTLQAVSQTPKTVL